MYPTCASTARPAIRMPSIIWCGSYSIKSRSLQVPGSLSSALTTITRGLGELRGTKLHLSPVGKPAPPPQRRCLYFLDDRLGRHLLGLAKRLVAVVRQVNVERLGAFERKVLAD